MLFFKSLSQFYSKFKTLKIMNLVSKALVIGPLLGLPALKMLQPTRVQVSEKGEGVAKSPKEILIALYFFSGQQHHKYLRHLYLYKSKVSLSTVIPGFHAQPQVKPVPVVPSHWMQWPCYEATPLDSGSPRDILLSVLLVLTDILLRLNGKSVFTNMK